MLSNLGALVWMVEAVLALVGRSTSSDPAERQMFLAGATIGLVLLIDDFFLIHDWLHMHNRLVEQALIALYFISIVLLVGRFRLALGPVAVVGLTVAFGFLSASAGLDLLFNDLDQLVEDGMKFLGICTWSATWVLRAAPWRFRPAPARNERP